MLGLVIIAALVTRKGYCKHWPLALFAFALDSRQRSRNQSFTTSWRAASFASICALLWRPRIRGLHANGAIEGE